MTNMQALYLSSGTIVLVMLMGYAAHTSPDGKILAGLLILSQEAITGVVGLIGQGLSWFFNTAWIMETVKNVFQAALFAGASLAGLFNNGPSLAQSMSNQATIAGFVVFAIMMALATRRVESLRSIATLSSMH